jgi:hypothetical protein
MVDRAAAQAAGAARHRLAQCAVIETRLGGSAQN